MAEQADTPELREKLLNLAREWMRAVTADEGLAMRQADELYPPRSGTAYAAGRSHDHGEQACLEIVGPVILLAVLIYGTLQWSRRRRGRTAGKQPRVSAIGKVRAQAEKREEAGLAGDNAQDQRSGTDNPLA